MRTGIPDNVPGGARAQGECRGGSPLWGVSPQLFKQLPWAGGWERTGPNA